MSAMLPKNTSAEMVGPSYLRPIFKNKGAVELSAGENRKERDFDVYCM